MKSRIAINLLFLLSVIFLTANLHADWKSDWEKITAAAKKEGQLNLSTKLPLSGRMALTFPFASPTHYGLGQHGWVTSHFKVGDEVRIRECKPISKRKCWEVLIDTDKA